MDMLYAYFMAYIWRSEDRVKELRWKISGECLCLAGLSISLALVVVVSKHLFRDKSDFVLFILR